ncbi:hypothetical protein SISNIDRAFT_487141 [Sistotremastrum niveocremeum HHB9708]|uniref:Uncharacterized protein n=1 Tax=Sistotremastrum niveocremeum HHB9708 TaxID=1314777 RepID=A0A164SUU3_9AGAM|nr:hypothetical protein SISNIDRAFT_487141 [Sistotremastrum niveocremeum HHB9708]
MFKFSNLFVLSVVLCAFVASATPLDARAPELVEVPDVHVTEFEAADAIEVLLGEFEKRSPNDGLHALVARANPDACFCKAKNCASGCKCTALNSLTAYKCYTPGYTFDSVYISDSANAGLPYSVYVGACASGTRIPKENTCYNISPATSLFYKS